MALEEMRQRKREEYEMQLFGRHSRETYDGMKNMIDEEIESLCNKLCKSIEKKYNPGPEELSKLRTDAKKLIKTYENRSENHMDELNKIVRKFIAIPNHLLLDEDKGQAIEISQDEFDRMNWRMEDLRKRAREATMFNAALRQELEIQEKFKVCENSINKSSKEIKNHTILPCIEDKIEKFTQESEKLYNQLEACDPTNNQKKIYSPIIENLRDLDSMI